MNLFGIWVIKEQEYQKNYCVTLGINYFGPINRLYSQPKKGALLGFDIY
jgi:hypothetical protein